MEQLALFRLFEDHEVRHRPDGLKTSAAARRRQPVGARGSAQAAGATQDPLDLRFDKKAQRLSRRRRQSGEALDGEAVHQAVIGLRKAGSRVYQSGRDHNVDGRLLSSEEILKLHRAVERSRIRSALADRLGE
jgi:hypothetical protein